MDEGNGHHLFGEHSNHLVNQLPLFIRVYFRGGLLVQGVECVLFQADSGGLYVGRSQNSEASNAYIGEIIYYNRPLSDTERDGVVAYLRQRWGI